MSPENYNMSFVELTATEVSNVWSSYLKSSMDLGFLNIYLQVRKITK